MRCAFEHILSDTTKPSPSWRMALSKLMETLEPWLWAILFATALALFQGLGQLMTGDM